ncbi:diacylglycerol kinase family protein [Hymenobacter cavernae]|uniref:Undecaprenol kinase n=1 Tax=Hymenobacter cavernae TaxID=2044852 RepID=A0ABQ1TT03_9BACT|nr:diacylglycerol kinase family protein [Hymenobacter cavernae]GGF03090.1 undecaprenol kinase [Hymenobacter cavernae]
MTPVAKPNPDKRSLLRRRAASFGHAFRGIWLALRSELHLQFHAAATVIVVGLGFYFELTATEWMLVAVAVGTVWTAELVNTAIEALTDLVSPEYHPLAGKAKDVAAGAVLVAAVAALVVGLFIFGPRVLALVH